MYRKQTGGCQRAAGGGKKEKRERLRCINFQLQNK